MNSLPFAWAKTVHAEGALEAAVSLRIQGEKALKKRGDVLVVKLAGSPWGREEKKRFLILQFDDSDLESRLMDMKSKGEPHPVLVHPYAAYEDQAVPPGHPEYKPPVMTSRSTKYVDIQDLSAKDAIDALNPDKTMRIFKKHEISLKERPKLPRQKAISRNNKYFPTRATNIPTPGIINGMNQI